MAGSFSNAYSSPPSACCRFSLARSRIGFKRAILFFPCWVVSPCQDGRSRAAARVTLTWKFSPTRTLSRESWSVKYACPAAIYFGRDDDPQYFDGVLGPSLILLLPMGVQGQMIEEKKLLISFALLFFVYALFLVDLRVRYILPIVPPMVILLTYGVFNVYLRIKQPAYLFAALFGFAAFNGYYLWRYFQEIAPLGYVTGRETQSAYLTRALPEYPAFQYINRELSPATKIYLSLVGRRGYYCEREYFHDGGELPGFLLGAIR